MERRRDRKTNTKTQKHRGEFFFSSVSFKTKCLQSKTKSSVTQPISLFQMISNDAKFKTSLIHEKKIQEKISTTFCLPQFCHLLHQLSVCSIPSSVHYRKRVLIHLILCKIFIPSTPVNGHSKFGYYYQRSSDFAHYTDQSTEIFLTVLSFCTRDLSQAETHIKKTLKWSRNFKHVLKL